MKSKLTMMTLAAAAALVLAGCGGIGGGSQVSCDWTDNSEHSCIEWTWTGTSAIYSAAYWNQACTQSHSGATTGTACTHVGAVGGCHLDYAGVYTATNWYYTGTAATLQQGCTALNQSGSITATWVNP